MEVSGQLHLHTKSLWYPFVRRLGVTQGRFGRLGEEKNSQPLPGLKPPIIQLVVQRYTTEFSRQGRHYFGTIIVIGTL
jgi:hypothetical protein